MLDKIKELYNFRELLKNLVIKELKLRYKRSVLGFLWTMLVLERELAKKLVAFARAGGKVCLLGDFPTGSPESGINDRHIIGLMDKLISIKSVVKSKNGIDWLLKNKYLKSHITLIDREFQMYQQHKVIDGKDFYWLINNTGEANISKIEVANGMGLATKWNCETVTSYIKEAIDNDK